MLQFVKMHGLGNDFVVIDAINQQVNLGEADVRRIADRHFGVGCDQLLLVEKPEGRDADFRYRIFNADGSEVAQCGNGARCFARFVREQGLTAKTEIRVETRSGHLLLRHEADGLVTVDMGVPRHAPAEIPLLAEREAARYPVEVDGQALVFGAASIGNPHAVLLVDNSETAPVEKLGALLERHDLFPERANIGFMQVLDRQSVRLRVFERGVGETLACGSGACAAVVVGNEWGLLDDKVRVALPGGELLIRWSGRDQPVLMSGPAVTVFNGSLLL
ncbi:diaminopimelate epimerase [Candidatus Methylospira mobilis]|uniref:Diaminopimelate epimerase n=1 Tax=Candidatus Methylospira mobilis TaxID=1808979 RepID=A0A5Q0BN10_9GAMM|nr:diaminopimelate epimerase [Candidatus Methylospira mobilis]QFY43487.1 diaminopimelate epimerase [Candidatus Methylospira mobilis]WNV03971.1 diaminopimelate epimerase [Candidatus Methylospira mobilis]